MENSVFWSEYQKTHIAVLWFLTFGIISKSLSVSCVGMEFKKKHYMATVSQTLRKNALVKLPFSSSPHNY